jgi:hypothetical protein
LEIAMDRRLFPLAELAAFTGILAGGYTVVSSAREPAVAAIAVQASEPQAVLPPHIAARTAAPIPAARPPVPLLLSSRPPPKAADIPPAVTEPADEQATAEAAARAKALIEADGYKRVRAVKKAPDGRWRGLALRGAEEVAVSVDDNGNVSTQ